MALKGRMSSLKLLPNRILEAEIELGRKWFSCPAKVFEISFLPLCLTMNPRPTEDERGRKIKPIRLKRQAHSILIQVAGWGGHFPRTRSTKVRLTPACVLNLPMGDWGCSGRANCTLDWQHNQLLECQLFCCRYLFCPPNFRGKLLFSTERFSILGNHCPFSVLTGIILLPFSTPEDAKFSVGLLVAAHT